MVINDMKENANSLRRENVNDDYKAEYKAKFLKCRQAVKYVNDLGIPEDKIDEAIVKINDFVDDLNYCQNCPGIKACQKKNPMVINKLTYTNGVVDVTITPCKKFLEKVSVESNLKVNDFDGDSFDIELTKIDKSSARAKVLKKYSDYLEDVSDDWIYITGSLNSGRTYLANALAVDLARKNKGPVCFINASLRFKEMADASYRDKARFQRMLDLFSTCQVLFIDDFGSELKTDFIRNGVLLPIINKRAAKHLLTVFTSDYTLDEICQLYSTSKVAEIEAKKIYSIIKMMAKKEINLGEVSVY